MEGIAQVEFSNLLFLYIFLPLTVGVYFLMPKMQWKNTVLIVASLVFYAVGQPIYVVLLIGLSYANFALAKRMVPGKKMTLLLPVAINLSLLCLLKYLDFFLGIFGLHVGNGILLSGLTGLTKGINSLLGTSLQTPKTILPIGISFYTFQAVSYLVDVYRGKSKAQTSFSHMLLYLCMFPKIMQGPIVRYEQIEPQLTKRRSEPRMIFEGVIRFALGLGKKVLLADYAGKVVADLTSQTAELTMVGAWLSALMFMFQIYFDFSGYSDMAIGLGRIFGFRYAENFDLPYTSGSITEFWRRWHMSLGSFFRDYVYIPLGGNRKGRGRQILNLLVVWALTGLWHGANWNYVLWGLYFFVLLATEKQLMPKIEKLPYFARNLTTMTFVLFGWVIFANEDMGQLGRSFAAMFGGAQFCTTTVAVRLANALPLLVCCVIGVSVLPRWTGFIWSGLMDMGRGKRRADTVTAKKAIYVVSMFLLVVLIFWLCTVSLVGSTSAPSIYANF